MAIALPFTSVAPPRTAGAGGGRRQRLWAELMARTFGIDVLACPRCGGRLRLVAVIEDARVVGHRRGRPGGVHPGLIGRAGRPWREPCVRTPVRVVSGRLQRSNVVIYSPLWAR